ncbi:DUF3397 domain-containing protein [Ornithinibacillus scapharcae]|uniref:DUF3397 domain-containing protein n=1 Tax=Ornithinibacillus scapharcae TaxID=1147159 RepID=UPI000225BEF7|nr:DUF3397 domain-containing protein [Ornithinibacillus scapharcae]
MFEIILFILAFMITVPFIVTVILFYGLNYLFRNPVMAFHKAINWTTILYILSVNTLLTYLFGGFYIGYIVVFLLCILTVVIIIQWKNHTEVDIRKAIKLLWRLSFLIFFLLYSIFTLFGIGRNIFA